MKVRGEKIMRVIKVFFSVLGVLILLIGVVTLIVLLAQGSLSTLKYPEWARFENEMMDSYPDIERMAYADGGPTFSIRYHLEHSLDWDTSKEIFERTRNFIL